MTLEAELLSVSEELLEVGFMPAQSRPGKCNTMLIRVSHLASASHEMLRCGVSSLCLGFPIYLGVSCGADFTDLQMSGYITTCELLL